MTRIPERPAIRELLDAGATHVEARPLDVEDSCRQYTEAGYEVTPQLREFLEHFGELTISLTYRDWVGELSVSVEGALDLPPRNVRIDGKRIGRPVLPVGTAFDTEESVLLAENGDIFLAGDAGIQHVANGFENAIRALVTGDWDKTFF